MEPIEHVEFLSRSEHRISVLRHLRESGPTTKREFREELSASRSTVTRSLSALEERGWITSNSDTYELTPAGRGITDQYLDLTDAVELTEELSPILELVSASELDFDIEHLSDATVTESTDSDPYAPVRKHMAAFEEAQSIRSVLPSVDLEVAQTFRDRLEDPGFSGVLVVTAEIAHRFAQPEYEAVVNDMLDAENCDILVSEEDFPYYLGILEGETVQIGIEDGQGYPRALLETDDVAVYEWAMDEFDRYRERASPMEDV
jgi:predicted transcriptional regulator